MSYCDNFSESGFVFNERDKVSLNNFYERTNKLKSPYIPLLLDYEFAALIKDSLDEIYDGFPGGRLIPLWADVKEKKYLAYFYEGPLSEKICFIGKNEDDLSPIFKNIRQANEFMLEHKTNCLDIIKKTHYYPLGYTRNKTEENTDFEIAKNLYSKISLDLEMKEHVKVFTAFVCMRLTPSRHCEFIMEFLNWNNEKVLCRACEILEKNLYIPAHDELYELMKNKSEPVGGKNGAAGKAFYAIRKKLNEVF